MNNNRAETSVSVGGTRWLDEEEQAAWRAYMNLNTHLMARLNHLLQRDCGVSNQDYAVLVNLSESPDQRLRAFELGRELEWEKSRLSHHLSRMEQRGLVERVLCPSDRRGAFIALTAAGRQVIEEAAPLHVDAVRRLFIDVLTPAERQSLRRGAERVLDLLSAEGEAEGCPGSGPCDGAGANDCP